MHVRRAAVRVEQVLAVAVPVLVVVVRRHGRQLVGRLVLRGRSGGVHEAASVTCSSVAPPVYETKRRAVSDDDCAPPPPPP